MKRVKKLPYLNFTAMNKKRCLNCRQIKNIIEFPIMRISVRGRALFCIECMELMRNKSDFWVMYAKLQNDYPVYIQSGTNTLQQSMINTVIGSKVYPKCTSAMPYIRTIKYIPKRIKKLPTRIFSKESVYKIIQYDKQGFEVAAYDTIFFASTKTGFPIGHIARVLDTETALNGFKFVSNKRWNNAHI